VGATFIVEACHTVRDEGLPLFVMLNDTDQEGRHFVFSLCYECAVSVSLVWNSRQIVRR
jgi:hypothetical protein